MGIDEYAPLAARLYWISCNVVFIWRDTHRGENLGKCLHPTATPHSESKKGTRILDHHFSLRPAVFHNWFLFTGKVNKKFINAKKNLHQSQEFFSRILDHQIYITAKAYWRLVFPIFFIETKLSRRDRHGSRRERERTPGFRQVGGGCQESLRGLILSWRQWGLWVKSPAFS